MPRSRSLLDHDIVISTDDGKDWWVEQDRRVLIDMLTLDEAIAYAERVRKPDERVMQADKDGYETDITKRMRVNRRSRV